MKVVYDYRNEFGHASTREAAMILVSGSKRGILFLSTMID
jgi:hypothetical protein